MLYFYRAPNSLPTAVPGVASLIPVRSCTFVEIDHEKDSTIILLLPHIQEGLLQPFLNQQKEGITCCQLQAKVCAHSTKKSVGK